MEHVKWIMHRHLEAGHYVKSETCKNHKETIRYLGLMISTEGISMDKDEVNTVRN